VKRRRLFVTIFGVLAAVILTFTLWPREREPEFKGKTLTAWLSHCGSRDYAGIDETADAVRHIGTNAMPYLIRWIQYESGWKDSIARKVIKWPVIGDNRFVQRIIWNTTAYRAASGVFGFQVLGPKVFGPVGSPTMDELLRLANNPKKPETQARAMKILNLIERPTDYPGALPTRWAPPNRAFQPIQRKPARAALTTRAGVFPMNYTKPSPFRFNSNRLVWLREKAASFHNNLCVNRGAHSCRHTLARRARAGIQWSPIEQMARALCRQQASVG
jgi:hypothetical protein